MCDIDLEQCDVFRETPRVARKAHRCSSCGARIAPREAYLDHFSNGDGPCAEAMCFACWCAREEFMEGGHPLFNPSALHDLVSGCIEDEETERRWRPLLDALNDRYETARAGAGA